MSGICLTEFLLALPLWSAMAVSCTIVQINIQHESFLFVTWKMKTDCIVSSWKKYYIIKYKLKVDYIEL